VLKTKLCTDICGLTPRLSPIDTSRVSERMGEPDETFYQITEMKTIVALAVAAAAANP